MGLFDFMSKMVKGEPIFDAQPPSASRAAEPSGSGEVAQADPTRHDTGHKIHPEIKVTRLTTRRNGSTMQTYIWIQNDAPFAIELRSFRIMGRTLSMGYQLAPGRGQEVQIYSGPIAKDEGENDAHADYRIVQNGDYFQQEFHVEFDRQSDGTFLIEELHPDEHVRDI